MQIPKPAMFRHSLLLFLFIGYLGFSQSLTGTDLLDKAIAYHDANENWKNFRGAMSITMNTPNSGERNTELFIDFPANYFKSLVVKDNNRVESILDKNKCILKLNGSSEIPQKYRDSLRITCDRARMMKDYYTYLYGLPMKLKDTGTIVHPKVEKKTFNGKEYFVLKINYEEQVGKDTWYFYFDPKTYAMQAYQFYHDETKNDGEYILLKDIIEVNGIKMPKIRTWYYNKNNSYLGTDTLTKANSL